MPEKLRTAIVCPIRSMDSSALSTLLGLGATLILMACNVAPSNISDDSEFLKSTVVPAIVEWANGDNETLALSALLSSRGYGPICVVPEYTSLSAVEAEVGEIGTYHGARGPMVPESTMAFIALKGSAAHVAFVRQRDIVLYGDEKHCHPSSRVLLRRETRDSDYTPRAVLTVAP